jgi:hypothetical protein
MTLVRRSVLMLAMERGLSPVLMVGRLAELVPLEVIDSSLTERLIAEGF